MWQLGLCEMPLHHCYRRSWGSFVLPTQHHFADIAINTHTHACLWDSSFSVLLLLQIITKGMVAVIFVLLFHIGFSSPPLVVPPLTFSRSLCLSLFFLSLILFLFLSFYMLTLLAQFVLNVCPSPFAEMNRKVQEHKQKTKTQTELSSVCLCKKTANKYGRSCLRKNVLSRDD